MNRSLEQKIEAAMNQPVPYEGLSNTKISPATVHSASSEEFLQTKLQESWERARRQMEKMELLSA